MGFETVVGKKKDCKVKHVNRDFDLRIQFLLTWTGTMNNFILFSLTTLFITLFFSNRHSYSDLTFNIC
jgi:hypothetical protein